MSSSPSEILQELGKGGTPPQQQPQQPGASPPAAPDPKDSPGETNAFGNSEGKEMVAAGDNKIKQGLLPSLEDLLFYTIAEGQEKIPVHKFITWCVQSNIVLLTQAFRRKFVIPDFMSFTSHIDELYESAKKQSGGKVADYIPQLAKFSPDLWGVSVCTVDGQSFFMHSIGDTKVPFCLQSCVKPLKYAIAVNDLGTEYVHRYVGKEPSGLRFNKLFLNEDDKPHNPMVNAGAIVVTSLIKEIGGDPQEMGEEAEQVFKRISRLWKKEDLDRRNLYIALGSMEYFDNCNSSMKLQGVNNAEKFDYVMQFLNKMAGNEYVGFSNATNQTFKEQGQTDYFPWKDQRLLLPRLTTFSRKLSGDFVRRFQSERESGDRNFAIGYYLKEKKCFPEGTDMVGILDFYFQLCSIEVTCESASVMAATLANGGFCPITGERVLSPEAVRNTLSLMHSCGMYDFSGQFAFHVGLPAKSGVAGGILLVVPNVMGMMCWSPPLDKMGNSVKGIHFCHDLVSLCNFHNYDNLRHFAKKLDPRREGGDQRSVMVKSVINLLFAAYTGDVSALRRFALSAMDMEQRDYDSRTALHVAAAEGHVEVVKFLLEACKVNPFPKDRWNNTPMDEALHFGHHDVFKILQEYQVQYTPQGDSDDGKEKQTVHKNLDGLL
ncbi:Glutaminase kidney isoform, mitochondrial [Apodemus speciosus]|uniref:glutaminase n=1 Tax=Apodemus speciosus TaxID=105296 RepID=A0ABQ0EDP3_APOSI